MLRAFGVLFVFFTVLACAPFLALASSTDGTIDGTYKYAWSERFGWVNMGTSGGNVHVTDAGLTGYAWTENTGWIILNHSSSVYVANDAEGNLSGYGWGEGIGYVNFSGVTIDSDGFFHGYASSTISGRINFNCSDLNTCGTSDFRTKTDWRKASVRNASSGSVASVPIGGGALGLLGVVNVQPGPASAAVSHNTSGGEIPQVPARYGETNGEVSKLQVFLNTHGYPVARAGTGSAGKESNYFGTKTKNALIRFQRASSDAGVIEEEGFLGLKTLAYIANLSAVPVCPPYMLKYIRLNRSNDVAEVKKLQDFLNRYEGFTDLKITGIYSKTDFDAVVVFQNKYMSDVLGPWETAKPTGYVYKTTLKKINELYCMYLSKKM